MQDKPTSCAGELRKMAESCRRMANDLSSPRLARQLEEIADDYEHDADRIEERQSAAIRNSFVNAGSGLHR